MMWISRFAPPTIVISPTPLAVSSFCLICLSAISVRSRMDRGAHTAMRNTGAASGSNFWITGCFAVCGRSGTIRLTWFCTSCAATSPFFESRKVTTTSDWPSDDVDRTSSTWLMVLIASSTFLLISLSISSGDAPGLEMVTSTVGTSTFGNRSTPRLK